MPNGPVDVLCPSGMLLRRMPLLALVAAAPLAAAPRIATDGADFLQPGTQPSPALVFEPAAPVCQGCHGQYRDSSDVEPWDGWVASMMAQSARDPVMRAAAAIANADAGQSVETCIRCHAPIGWLAGRSTGADFAALEPADLDGVTCHVCHRMVDPIGRAVNPAADAAILDALQTSGTRPDGRCHGNRDTASTADADCGAAQPCDVAAGQGRYVVDPQDRRRGPYDIASIPHVMLFSPFHRASGACAACHDVSTPTYTRQPDDTYVLNDLGQPHPTQRPEDMFPEQRTYTEWRASEFAATGVVFPDGRFGGARTAMLPNVVPVSSCQDCHMPAAAAQGCVVGPTRADLGQHFFAGGNTWVLSAILAQDGTSSGLDDASVAAAHARTADMLGKAADLELTQAFDALSVRVVNQTGHKLPTGYPEGRRMWLAVRFFAGTTLLAEDGAYDAATGTLDLAHTTKRYEARHVVDAAIGALAGLPAGTPFHLMLNNRVDFDSRIPPRGFTNAAFAALGAAPVGYAYADGQFWDDTAYAIPAGATRVEVTLFHQTTTREYAEFLRDGTPDGTGPAVYAQWEAAGRSAPAVLAHVERELAPRCTRADGPCCGIAEGGACDDGDACTSGDVCTAGACAGAVARYDDVRCLLDALGAAPACADAPKSFARALAQRVKGVRSALATAERLAGHGASARRVRSALRRVKVALAKLGARVAAAERARRGKRITHECAEAVQGVVERGRAAIGTLGSSRH